MSKELEAFDRILNANNHFKYDTLELMEKDAQIVHQGLQRLEAIDNANPSEALEDLKELHELAYGNEETSWKIDEIRMSSHIKQALIKAQEQEKVLKILKEKCVDIYLLKSISTLEEYNKNIGLRGIELTEEEFDLLKRYCSEQNNT